MDVMVSMPTIMVESTFVADGAMNSPYGDCAPLGAHVREGLEVMDALVADEIGDDEARRELSATTATALKRGVDAQSSDIGKFCLAYAPYEVSPGTFYILRDSDSFVCNLASVLLEGVPPNGAVAITAVVEYEYGRATLFSGAQQCPAASVQHDRTRRGWRRRE